MALTVEDASDDKLGVSVDDNMGVVGIVSNDETSNVDGVEVIAEVLGSVEDATVIIVVSDDVVSAEVSCNVEELLKLVMVVKDGTQIGISCF